LPKAVFSHFPALRAARRSQRTPAPELLSALTITMNRIVRPLAVFDAKLAGWSQSASSRLNSLNSLRGRIALRKRLGRHFTEEVATIGYAMRTLRPSFRR
jgi:hypothetical protein